MKREVAGMTEAEVEEWMLSRGRQVFILWRAGKITYGHYACVCADAVQNYCERIASLVHEKVTGGNSE